MDVKAGSGAFMPSREQSVELARAIVAVARGNGLACEALITDMDQVLGRTAGNAVEVREALGVLTHPREAEPRLVEVTLALCATLLRLGGLHPDDAAARAAAGEALASGAAAERFARMCVALGGPCRPARRPRPPPAARAARARGLPRGQRPRRARSPCATSASPCWSSAAAAAARTTRSTTPSGSSTSPGWGRRSARGGRPLAVVHARDADAAERAAARVRAAFEVGDAPAAQPPLTEALA